MSLPRYSVASPNPLPQNLHIATNTTIYSMKVNTNASYAVPHSLILKTNSTPDAGGLLFPRLTAKP